MIALFGRDEYSVLGIASLLDIEKIPYRRVSKLEDCDPDLLVVVTPDLSPMESASIERRPAVVLNGGVQFARHVFGVGSAEIKRTSCAIALDERVWPAAVAELAQRFGKSALRIPLAPVCEPLGTPARGTILASLSASQPAIMRVNRCVWSLVDLGAAFANLLSEDYLATEKHDASRPWVRRTKEGAYYAAPDFVRRSIHRRYYARLQRRLDGRNGTASEYPIDATGWLLIELVKHLIRLAAGKLVRLDKWPAPYRAAATLTHDVEPRRYAYTTGLDRLLKRTAAAGHPATVGLVAEASEHYLTDRAVSGLCQHAVMCHGLTHRGESVHGRLQLLASMHTARKRLQRQLGRQIAGYRSPRLDRSADLAWALDQSDFQYDSSYPDVDRENINHFGTGVRLNFPYRQLVDGVSGMLRPSKCLELPLTAPDCIQPLFVGEDVATLRATVETKAAFVRAIGGLYVALVHAGVFGSRDAAVREDHMDFVRRQLCHPDVWLTEIDHIAAWWKQREKLRISVRDGAVCVVNDGAQTVAGAQVVVEHGTAEITLPVPPLAPGAHATLTMPHRITLPAA